MAGIVPKRTLETIRYQNDIAELIGSYIQLQRAGANFKANCPFHKEKTPSFHVNTERQIFHCFGCGAGGDVFKFLMQYEGLDFMGAVRMLADRAGIELELKDDDGRSGDRRKMYEVLSELCSFYQTLSRRHARGGIGPRLPG